MATPAYLCAELGFLRPDGIAPDTRRRDGVLRAPSGTAPEDICSRVAMHPCRIADCNAPGIEQPQLDSHGFETVDLSALTALQDVLTTVNRNSMLEPAQVKAIKHHLRGQRLPLADGRSARILFIAGEGLIIRKSGPNGMSVTDHETPSAHNGHVAAMAVHADQDVYGTPIRQLLLGLAPRLFRHESPNGSNRRSPLHLLNLWIPLQQRTRPLAFMDQRTLDRRAHQLRYALPVDYFLDRDGQQKLNDVWGFLPDDGQRWFFRSGMDSQHAWLFNTLGCPHGSFVEPGEAIAETRYRQLAAACQAIANHNADALHQATRTEPLPLPEDTPTVLADAIRDMTALLDEARLNSAGIAAHGNAWCDHARMAMDKVVRKSIEMRMVVWVS